MTSRKIYIKPSFLEQDVTPEQWEVLKRYDNRPIPWENMPGVPHREDFIKLVCFIDSDELNDREYAIMSELSKDMQVVATQWGCDKTTDAVVIDLAVVINRTLDPNEH